MDRRAVLVHGRSRNVREELGRIQQPAGRRPPALKAIVTVCSTDDRYADDIHTMGGCQLLENPNWSFSMFGHNARPPDPLLAGEGWKEPWMQRLENNVPWILEWLRHQRRDAYWKHGSVCEDYSEIACPVLAIGGWADPYTNPVPPLMKNLRVPRRALIGPWGHQYPHQANPGPMAGFLQESLRWWDQWLKKFDTGVLEDPMVRVWMHESYPPAAVYEDLPGHWIAENDWPSDGIHEHAWYLNPHGLGESPGSEEQRETAAPATVGRTNPFWGSNGACAPECALDQRPDDAVSLCFDSAPLAGPLAFLGTPVAKLRLASNRPVAQVSARLSEVRADGSVTLVSLGLLNLNHDATHERVSPLVPGEELMANVRLNYNAYRFAAGSRIRLAVASGLWPVAWPSPESVRLTVRTGRSKLVLPVRPEREEDNGMLDIPPPECTRVSPRTHLKKAAPVQARFVEDVMTGRLTFLHQEDNGVTRIDSHGWIHGGKIRRRFGLHPGDPLNASAEMEGEHVFGRESSLDVRVRTYQRMTSDHENFHIQARLDVAEAGRYVFSRSWLESIPRDGV